MNYQFMLELAKLSEDELHVLRNIGPTVQVASSALEAERSAPG